VQATKNWRSKIHYISLELSIDTSRGESYDQVNNLLCCKEDSQERRGTKSTRPTLKRSIAQCNETFHFLTCKDAPALKFPGLLKTWEASCECDKAGQCPRLVVPAGKSPSVHPLHFKRPLQVLDFQVLKR